MEGDERAYNECGKNELKPVTAQHTPSAKETAPILCRFSAGLLFSLTGAVPDVYAAG